MTKALKGTRDFIAVTVGDIVGFVVDFDVTFDDTVGFVFVGSTRDFVTLTVGDVRKTDYSNKR